LTELETGMAEAETILAARAAELESIDDTIMCEAAGVAQAAGDLRKALDALDGLLDERKFEKAAVLGYRDIASAFIFLQRTLGGLQSADLDRDAFTSSIAAQLHCAFEDAEPHVSARLQCLKPKPDLTDEERAAAQARFQRRLREMTSASKS
jgi:Cdc6-like AAA superfamily ATPase